MIRTISDSMQAHRQREEFIAVLAHELRNPIAPLRSGLELLVSGRLEEAGRQKTMAMMQRQLSHLVRLVDDLLDASRVNANDLRVDLRPAPIVDRLEPPAPQTAVNADPVRLAQAFTNILSSSIRKTPRRGTIAIDSRVDEEDGVVSISFEDGPLMEQESGPGRGSAPDRGTQVLSDQVLAGTLDDGIVIGLGLVRGLIALHGGSVDAHTAAGGCARAITVCLPLLASAETPPLPTPAPSTAEDWQSHSVLVVDDNKDAATTLSLLLELDGLTVQIAHDGLSAVRSADEWQPEIIFMDIGLPGFSGIEATRQIRAAQPPVRPYIVALTGWGTSADRLATAEAGCDLHLTKPLNYEQLRAALPSLIRSAAGLESGAPQPSGTG